MMATPGFAYLKSSGRVYLGGEVRVLERPLLPEFPAHHRDPAETREIFSSRAWTTVVGFQTRNPMHRAHEYITKCALEICDGLLDSSPRGRDQGRRRPRRGAHAMLRSAARRVLPAGRGCSSRFIRRPCATAARAKRSFTRSRARITAARISSSGAITRGSAIYYGKADAQKIFEQFAPGELGIMPLPFEDAFYSRAVSGMATIKTAPGDDARGPRFRAASCGRFLRAGQSPPPELVRPEVAEILLGSMKGG